MVKNLIKLMEAILKIKRKPIKITWHSPAEQAVATLMIMKNTATATIKAKLWPTPIFKGNGKLRRVLLDLGRRYLKRRI